MTTRDGSLQCWYLVELLVQSLSKRNNLEKQTTSILSNLFYTKSTAFVKLKKKNSKGYLDKGKLFNCSWLFPRILSIRYKEFKNSNV